MSKPSVCCVIGVGDATGSAVARRFAREGYTVCAARRNEEALRPLVQKIREQGGHAFAFGMDAYQLATQMSKIHYLPSYGISGFTGRLQLNKYQRIQRKLVCAKFEQGIPMPN